MVLPLIPLGIAAAAGGGGAVLGGLFGGKKETHTSQITYSPTLTEGARTYAPTKTFAPVTSYVYQGPTTITESPGTTVKKQATVKQTSKPVITPSFDIPTIAKPSSGGGITQGTDFVMIAAIAAVGLVGAAYFGKSKAPRRTCK